MTNNLVVPSRIPWIDWMKSLGMLLIVLGHTGAQNLFNPTPPFNFKQLGVAFFVFVMGFSLAKESRQAPRVLYNRLFEIYLFGTIAALVLSAIMLCVIGDPQESNYMPLIGGINVFVDAFPANQTTWYIGTYLHLLLVWAVVWRRVEMRPLGLLVVIVFEVLIRAVLIHHVGSYIAYMLVTNWTSVFILGMMAGREDTEEPPASGRRMLALVALMAVVVLWPVAVAMNVELAAGFPFQRLELDGTALSLLMTSLVVSLLYLTYSWLVYRVAECLPYSRLAEFFARNTLIVFIVHMPLINHFAPAIFRFVPQGAPRVLVSIGLFYVAPAFASEIIRRVISPRRLRDKIAACIPGRLGRALSNG